MNDKQEYKKIKREPIAVRMNTEVAALARQCAKEEYGSPEKLGAWLEDAIHHYAANRMDESRTTALLKILEESLFQRISVEIEGMHKQFTRRDNALEKRLAGLMAVSAYESCLTELMIKDGFTGGTGLAQKKQQARYEELRSAAARSMKEDIVSPVAEELRQDLAKSNKHLRGALKMIEILTKTVPGAKEVYDAELAKTANRAKSV